MTRDASAYARQTGARMRAARRARGLSLKAIEENSGGRFKAVLIGSYERADRRVTLERLTGYAAFLEVHVTELLPPEPRREAQVLAYAASVAERAVADMTAVFGRMSAAEAASLVASALRAIAPPEVRSAGRGRCVTGKSDIQWTDATWNPTSGCDRVSPGCDHCYAMTLGRRLKAMGSARYQRDGDPKTSGPGFGVSTHWDALDWPLRKTKPLRIFVNSMSDLFHDEVPDHFISRVFEVMAQARTTSSRC